MAIKSKWEAAKVLRTEADGLRRHGFTNFFSHQFACLLGQVLRPETCEGCLLAEFLSEECKTEAFPCQHVDQASWERIAAIPGLSERMAARLENIADELETLARREEPARAAEQTQ